MSANYANTGVENLAGKGVTNCSLMFFHLLNHKFKLREQLNQSGNVYSLNVLCSNYMLKQCVVHVVRFIVAPSTAVLTNCADECRLSLWWRCRAWWQDKGYTFIFLPCACTRTCVNTNRTGTIRKWSIRCAFLLWVELVTKLDFSSSSRKCVIPVVCVKLGKWYVVKHNCVTWRCFFVLFC